MSCSCFFSRFLSIPSFFLLSLTVHPPFFLIFCVILSNFLTNISMLMMFTKQLLLPLKTHTHTHTHTHITALLAKRVLLTWYYMQFPCNANMWLRCVKILRYTYIYGGGRNWHRSLCALIKCNHLNTKNTKTDFMKGTRNPDEEQSEHKLWVILLIGTALLVND
jgi:hypothetical protein